MKNECRRCGNSVGHRGPDKECPSCQYVIKLEAVHRAADEIFPYYSLGCQFRIPEIRIAEIEKALEALKT